MDEAVVHLGINYFVKPNGDPESWTDLVEWHCDDCNVGGDALILFEFIAQLTAHMFEHHRKGPGDVVGK